MSFLCSMPMGFLLPHWHKIIFLHIPPRAQRFLGTRWYTPAVSDAQYGRSHERPYRMPNRAGVYHLVPRKSWAQGGRCWNDRIVWYDAVASYQTIRSFMRKIELQGTMPSHRTKQFDHSQENNQAAWTNAVASYHTVRLFSRTIELFGTMPSHRSIRFDRSCERSNHMDR